MIQTLSKSSLSWLISQTVTNKLYYPINLQDEVNNTTIAAYSRTHKEIQMPFMSQESPVRKAGLTLASLEIKTFACPHAKIRQDTGDAKMAAKSMAKEIRMWSNSSFMSGMVEFCLYIE